MAAKSSYKLSCTLYGHTSDVRAVATFHDGSIISASRDMTARLWKPTGLCANYAESLILKGHKKFVSSVCTLKPSKKHPSGLIVTGSNDNHICIYSPSQSEPLHKFQAHENTVCNLRSGKQANTFLSSSWDLTAKLWTVDVIGKPQVVLHGHSAAVWCVADLPSGLIITGAADRLVIIWSRDGKILHKLDGHKDCVRDIATIKEDECLTCSNDSTIRHWNVLSGICLGNYSGHNNYIYGIVAISNGETVFTSGEDGTIHVWRNGEMDQIIHFPAQSIWCIDVLENGDIVSGASDGLVRIFSSDPERYASEDVLERFQEEVEKEKVSKAMTLGGINVKDVPDKSALQKRGKKDGETVMVRENDKVKAYVWSQSENRWDCVGDVTGASGGSNATSGKQLYNGIEYDYVFSVDIQDGVPPLKLPYNLGQDPWHVAQKFLHDNDLSQFYLDEVANFIVKNSQAAPVLNTNSGFADPFTGGNRYIPSGGSPASTSTSSGADPFTGGSRYIPSTNSTPKVNHPSNGSLPPSYIPHTHYLRLEQANLSAISEKLRELNSKLEDNKLRMSEEKLESVVKLANDKEEFVPESLNTLRTLFDWPERLVFPALDITRLAILRKEINHEISTEDLMRIVKRYIKPDSLASNQMLAFRLLANMFSQESGERLSLLYKDEIQEYLLSFTSLGTKNNQVAISTYILNLAVALNKIDDAAGRKKLLNTLTHLLPLFQESEALFRSLVALGTILAVTQDTNERNELINIARQSEATVSILRRISESTPINTNTKDKVVNCSKHIIDLIL